MAISTTVDMSDVKLQLVDEMFLMELDATAIANQFASMAIQDAKGSWKVPIFDNMAVPASALGENALTSAALVKQGARAIEFNPVKESAGVAHTEESEIVTNGQINDAAALNVGRTAGKVKGLRATQALDANIATAGGYAIQADANLVIDTGAIDVDTITGTDLYSYATAKKARAHLENMEAELFDGQYYFALAHTDVIEDLKEDTKWQDKAKYAQPEQLKTGEVGALNGIRYIRNPQATKVANVGTVDVYRTHVFGVNAFGVANDKLETLIVKPIPDDLSESQYYNAYKMFIEYKIVMRDALVTVLSAAS